MSFSPRFCESYLEKKNPCDVFDKHIVFDDHMMSNGERAHKYIIDGEEWKGSVTTFVHDFFPHFDADIVISKMMASKNWEISKYYGMSCDDIKEQWKKISTTASDLGTAMHASIEYFYNAVNEIEKEVIINECITPEFGYFLNFEKEIASKWMPWRTELRVFDRDLKLSGSIDMLYLSPNSTQESPLLIMYDWKRSKEIKINNPYENGMFPLTHIPNTNFWHYHLQLNVYKALIERNTNYRIESMALGVFHPNQENYVSIPIKDMSTEIESMFTIRRKKLQQLENPQPTLLDLFRSLS